MKGNKQAYYNGWLEGRGDMLMQIEHERKTVDRMSSSNEV